MGKNISDDKSIVSEVVKVSPTQKVTVYQSKPTSKKSSQKNLNPPEENSDAPKESTTTPSKISDKTDPKNNSPKVKSKQISKKAI